MRARLSLAVGAAVAMLTFGGAHAATVVNASFEDTRNFVNNEGGDDTDDLAGGSASMTGWTVKPGHDVAWIGPSNPFGLTASNGSYFLDLTGYSGGSPYGGVTQDITTVTGGHYQVKFDLGSSSSYGLPDGITLSAGSATHTFTSTLLGSNNWETETLDFTALGTTTTLDFQGASGANYIGLDNVLISGGAVPEPASWAMLMLGVFGAGAVLRRRRETLNLAV